MRRGKKYAPQNAKLHQTRVYSVAAALPKAKRIATTVPVLIISFCTLHSYILGFFGVGDRMATMIHLLLLLSFFSLSWCDPLSLPSLTITNVSKVVAPSTSNHSTTGLTTFNDCSDNSLGDLFTVNKADCERALDNLVRGKSLLEVRRFSYRDSVVVTDRLPVESQWGTCNLVLMMFDTDKIVSLTYAEIYAELLGPDGLLKECSWPYVAKVYALGGHTVLGPGNILIADVTGQPDRATN